MLRETCAHSPILPSFAYPWPLMSIIAENNDSIFDYENHPTCIITARHA